MGTHYFLKCGSHCARLLENLFVHVMGMRAQFNIISRETADDRIAMNFLAPGVAEFG
jgi:hypothetical protein